MKNDWSKIEQEFRNTLGKLDLNPDPAEVLAFFKERCVPITYSEHTLHAGLIVALRTFGEMCARRKIAGRPDWNHIHLRSDLGESLSRNSENNFAKLSYLGLVEHWKRGDWGLSDDGKRFLKGELRVQEGVLTRKKDGKPVVERRFGKLVGIRDFDGARPNYQQDGPQPDVMLLTQTATRQTVDETHQGGML